MEKTLVIGSTGNVGGAVVRELVEAGLPVRAATRNPSAMNGMQGVETVLFDFEAPGDHSCTVCTGTACFVKGATDIVTAVEARFEVTAGNTSPDGSLTLRTARCLGSCGLAPVVVLDGVVNAHLGPDETVELLTAALEGET